VGEGSEGGSGGEFLQEAFDLGADVGRGEGLVGSDEDDEIDAGGVEVFEGSEGFAELAFDAVARDGVSDFAGRGNAEAHAPPATGPTRYPDERPG